MLQPDADGQRTKPFISLLPNVKPEMATHEDVAGRHAAQAFTSSPLAMEPLDLLCPASSTFPGLKDVEKQINSGSPSNKYYGEGGREGLKEIELRVPTLKKRII